MKIISVFAHFKTEFHIIDCGVRWVRQGNLQGELIWIVRVGADAYVRSVRGPDGKWFQKLRDGATATLHAGDRSWRVTAELAPESIEAVSDALRKKYFARWGGPTEAMLEPNVLETTLRLHRA